MRVAGVGKIVINWWLLLLLNYCFNDLFTHFSKIPYTTETNNTHQQTAFGRRPAPDKGVCLESGFGRQGHFGNRFRLSRNVPDKYRQTCWSLLKTPSPLVGGTRPDNIGLRFVEGHLEKYFVVITKGYDHRKGQPNEYWDRAMNCDVVEHIQCQF